MSLHSWTKIKCAYEFDILFTLLFIINLDLFGTYKGSMIMSSYDMLNIVMILNEQIPRLDSA